MGRAPRISIHALLAESDVGAPEGADTGNISIHALLAESDIDYIIDYVNDAIFLSTLSLRRATYMIRLHLCYVKHFYPRSPCGERLFLLRKITITVDISIHALLAESDVSFSQLKITSSIYFYPRSPCGERPHDFLLLRQRSCISIHALLAESDSKSAQNSGALLRI